MREREGIISHIDGILFFTWLLLAIFGCFAIYSASMTVDESMPIFDLGQKHGQQFIFLIISLVAMFVVWALDYRLIFNLTPTFYFITLILLVLTLVLGAEINGSKSWIKLGGFQIQPAEFAKLGTGLMLAWYLSQQDNVFQDWKKTSLALLIIGLPMTAILFQGDFGSMMIFTILIFVLYREGFTPMPILLGILLIIMSLLVIYFGFPKLAIAIAGLTLLALVLFRKRRGSWLGIVSTAVICLMFSFAVSASFTKVLKDYQQDRILVLLGMKEDRSGAGYNIWQSKMAIGSGGLKGKGYLNGTQTHGEFVPEVSTDYIFSSIGEEWGFLGSLIVVGLFSLLIFRILFLAERQRSNFSRIFMYSAACFFLMHVFVNIAMVIGIFPTVGIPLPFFSKGGSSLLAFSLLIAMVLRLDAERLYLL